MERKPLRRSLILIFTVFMPCLFNCTRIFSNASVRAVDMISLIALGMTIGAAICNIALYLKFRNKPV